MDKDYIIFISVIACVIFALLALAGYNIWTREKEKSRFGFFVFIVSLFISVLSLIIAFISFFKVRGDINPPKLTTTISETEPNEVTEELITTPVPTPMPTINMPDSLTQVKIVDQSDAGIDTGFGTDHFQIASTASDNYGNVYNNVGYFSWSKYYATEGWVKFSVADYSKVTGQIVAIDGERPSDNAIVKMYVDSGKVAEFTGIEKTTLPVDFSIDLSGSTLFMILTNSQEIMYVNMEFYH